MKSEMETIQILSSKLREEELENERLRRERDIESEKALRAAEDARVARESAEQYRVQLEEERKAQGDRIESMLKEVMMFITGKGTASLSDSLSDSIVKKMQEQRKQADPDYIPLNITAVFTPPMRNISDEDLPGILAVLDTAEQWCKDIREYAKSQALNGVRLYGWKLVRGRRGARTFTDEQMVREQLNRAGYDNEVIEKHGLKSVAEIEKIVGKNAFDALVGSYVAQKDGALELAPEDDKRPEYSTANVDFGDMGEVNE